MGIVTPSVNAQKLFGTTHQEPDRAEARQLHELCRCVEDCQPHLCGISNADHVVNDVLCHEGRE